MPTPAIPLSTTEEGVPYSVLQERKLANGIDCLEEWNEPEEGFNVFDSTVITMGNTITVTTPTTMYHSNLPGLPPTETRTIVVSTYRADQEAQKVRYAIWTAFINPADATCGYDTRHG